MDDKQKKKDAADMVDDWMNEIMGRLDFPNQEPAEPEQIGPDEEAVSAAGLTHPDDIDLERIVQETIAANWGEDFGLEIKDQEPINQSTVFFDPKETTGSIIPESAEQPAVPETPAAAEEDPQGPELLEKADAWISKIRPKANKGYGLLGIPHILATIIWLCLIVAAGMSLGRTLWVCAADLLALGKEPKEVTITIEEGDKIPEVAEKLQEAGMIRYPRLFEMFTSLTGKGNSILTGPITFKGTTVYDYNALINAMSFRGISYDTIDVMIPEGYNCAQIFSLLEKKGVCKVSELEAYALSGELNTYWFLEGIDRDHKYWLEGFLFPDTYNFYLNSDPRDVLEKFLNTFDYRFSDRMLEKMVELNKKTGLKLTIKEIVIMASIVEKEKANITEGYSISSVFYNRMVHAAQFPFLNSDATILYATDYRDKGKLVTDAQINASPYNTYTQRGLPPTPIANPGLSSLDAALDPLDTDYYYFIFDKSAGYHRFSKTLAEHERLRRELGYIS